MSQKIDPTKDRIRPVHEVIHDCLGGRVSPATLWRWRLKGVNGVKLECIRVGGRWMTTVAAFAEFLNSQTQNVLTACNAGVEYKPATRSAEKTRRLKTEGVL